MAAAAAFREALRDALHPDAGAPLDRERAEALLTDGAVIALSLERERLTLKRERRDALLAAALKPETAQEAARLAIEEQAVAHEIGELRALMTVARRRLTRRITR